MPAKRQKFSKISIRLLAGYGFLFNPLLNLYPFTQMNVFYDNISYLGNQLHQPLYLWVWALSSSFGLGYLGACLIRQEKPGVSVWWPVTSAFCFGAGGLSPYTNGTNGFLDSLHIWLTGAGLVLYACWLLKAYSLPQLGRTRQSLSSLLAMYLFSFLVYCLAGHVNGLCEMLFSAGMNALLTHLVLKNEKPAHSMSGNKKSHAITWLALYLY